MIGLEKSRFAPRNLNLTIEDVWNSIPEEYHNGCYMFVGDLSGCSKGFGPAPIIPEWFNYLTNEQIDLLIAFRKMHAMGVYHGGFKITRRKKG